MKIGIVCDDSLDRVSAGVPQYVLTIGRWLAAAGHEVHYLAGDSHSPDLKNLHSLAHNVRVRFNGNRLTIPLPANRGRIAKLMNRENFDVLYVQMPYSPFMAGRVIQAVGPKTAVVGMFHILPYTALATLGTKLLRLIDYHTLQRFDSCLSTSAATEKFARDAFGIDAPAFPLASDLNHFFKARLFTEYKNAKVVLFHGRLVERKGCLYLLEAVANLVEANKWPTDTKVLVSGAGPLEAKLKTYVQKHNLDQIVIFLGYTSEEDKARYMASADLVVYPSTSGESFGIVLLEAMAASRGAVLAGNNPGYACALPRPENLFDPTDVPALARKLLSFLNSAPKRAAAHSWQRDYVKQYDVPVVGKQLVEIFERAIKARRQK